MTPTHEIRQSPSTSCPHTANILGFLTFAAASITLFGMALFRENFSTIQFVAIAASAGSCGVTGLITTVGTRVLLSRRPDFCMNDMRLVRCYTPSQFCSLHQTKGLVPIIALPAALGGFMPTIFGRNNTHQHPTRGVMT